MSRQKKVPRLCCTRDKSGQDRTQTKQADLNTAIAGKVAGVQLRGGSGAQFGTVRILPAR